MVEVRGPPWPETGFLDDMPSAVSSLCWFCAAEVVAVVVSQVGLVFADADRNQHI
jgi:hypothetical protein